MDSRKRDAKGRRILPGHEWKRLLAEYERSDLTQEAFARREGLNVHTLVAWLGRIRKRKLPIRQTNLSGFRRSHCPRQDLLSGGTIAGRPGAEW